MFRSSFARILFVAGISVLTIAGCKSGDLNDFEKKSKNNLMQDRDLNYSRDDYRNAMAPRPAEQRQDSLSTPVPELAPVIAEDKKNILPQPLVTLTVNQDVPIRDIFYELANQAEVDLELDPTITGSIIFTAYNRPFDQVVERISDMAGLRYTFKNNVLRVERDTPYLKTYHVEYLGMTRNYTSSIRSNTSAASGTGAGGGGGGGGGNNGSTSTITSTSSSDFWNELERNITQIIDTTNRQVALTDQSTPITTPNAIPAVTANQLTAVGENADGTTAAPAATATASAGGATATVTAPAGQQTAQAVSPPTPGLLNPTGTQNAAGGNSSSVGAGGGAAPAGGGAAAGGAAGMGGAGGGAANPYFSVNRQAGLVNVFATEKQHQKIGAYLKELLRAINTQVVIEAKVFEVELNDENSLGIDWSFVADSGQITGGVTLDQPNFPTNPFTSGSGAIFSISDNHVNAVVNAINRFGTIRTLSSPRLSVMNNQTAVLNVSESRVFFTIEIDRTDGTLTTPPRVDITSEVNNVPEGVIITVHPSIDPDTNEITMNLRPSITRVVRTVSDPGVALVAAQSSPPLNISSEIPELSIREIDSIVKMHSGSTIIMGGLMQDRVDTEQSSVPVLGEMPLVGALFRNHIDNIKKTEMVIMLRATVVNTPKPDQVDRDLYNKMGGDRRPLNF